MGLSMTTVGKKLVLGFAALFTCALASAIAYGGGAGRAESASYQAMNPLPEPVVAESVEYYPVSGKTEAELRRMLDCAGCTWDDGKRYDSVTSWRVTWKYAVDETPGSCSIASFRTFVAINYRYPLWQRSERAADPLLMKWDDFMQKLSVHEQGHRDMAVRAAMDIEKDVANLAEFRTCTEAEQAIRKLGKARLKKLNDEERAYDAVTNHGRTQGAIFP
jgi:predicted secreted Zn-dependent protease